MGPFHWKNRILRIAEIKRLQGIPDDFALVGSVEDQWRQVGNAVPPPLVEAVAKELRLHMNYVLRKDVAA
jgi:DNA (cytosine-5)-methyltransferase 1